MRKLLNLNESQAENSPFARTRVGEKVSRNIVQKVGLHGTAELTKYAIREGLTSLDD